MWIAGIILIVVAGGLFYGSQSRKKKVEEMTSTETATVQFLKSLADSMEEGVGEGHLQYATEVKGKVVCSDPIRSEIAEEECVYYSMRVKRKYEETYYETDNDEKEVRKTRTSTETLSSNSRSVPFHVDDGTGQIKINPGRAEFVPTTIINRFEPHADTGGKIQMGHFSFDVPFGFDDDRHRTLGYAFEEEAILPGRDLYVLGELTDADGELSIRHPAGEGRFIISAKSEEELMESAQSGMKWMMIGGIICAVAGICLIIFDFV